MVFNSDLREAAQKADIKLYMIADILGITDATFSRKLRRELSDRDKQRVFTIIEQLKSEKGEG